MAETFLNEQGITITRNRLVVNGKEYLFSKLQGGHIERPNKSWLSRLLKQPQTYRLVVWGSEVASRQYIFETNDPALADRITQAINKAVKARGGQRVR